MERSDAARGKAANHPAAVSGPPVPAWSGRPDRSGLSNARREEALMDARTAKEMKIMIYPVNIDKFTGFFDKFLKDNTSANHCNKKGYLYILASCTQI